MGPERPAMLRASLAAWPRVAGARRGREGRGPALSVVLKPRAPPAPGLDPGPVVVAVFDVAEPEPRRFWGSSSALRKGSRFSLILVGAAEAFPPVFQEIRPATVRGRSLRPGGGSAGSQKKGVFG